MSLKEKYVIKIFQFEVYKCSSHLITKMLCDKDSVENYNPDLKLEEELQM